ncbi:hypothetical protein [Nocardia sp. CA-135398]
MAMAGKPSAGARLRPDAGRVFISVPVVLVDHPLRQLPRLAAIITP